MASLHFSASSWLWTRQGCCDVKVASLFARPSIYSCQVCLRLLHALYPQGTADFKAWDVSFWHNLHSVSSIIVVWFAGLQAAWGSTGAS